MGLQDDLVNTLTTYFESFSYPASGYGVVDFDVDVPGSIAGPTHPTVIAHAGPNASIGYLVADRTGTTSSPVPDSPILNITAVSGISNEHATALAHMVRIPFDDPLYEVTVESAQGGGEWFIAQARVTKLPPFVSYIMRVDLGLTTLELPVSLRELSL